MIRHARSRFVIPVVLSICGLLALGALSISIAEPAATAVDKKFLLKEEPEHAANVVAIRNDAKDQEDVVVVGRIGGRKNPWISDVAAFSIVDRSLTPCNEMPGDMCTTPWDYCCETKLPTSTLLVMLHDVDGKPVKKDARQLLGVKELDTVVIKGKAKRDKAGNVSVVASKMYVFPDKNEPTQ